VARAGAADALDQVLPAPRDALPGSRGRHGQVVGGQVVGGQVEQQRAVQGRGQLDGQHVLPAAHDRIYHHSLRLEDARAQTACGQHSSAGQILEIPRSCPAGF